MYPLTMKLIIRDQVNRPSKVLMGIISIVVCHVRVAERESFKVFHKRLQRRPGLETCEGSRRSNEEYACICKNKYKEHSEGQY